MIAVVETPSDVSCYRLRLKLKTHRGKEINKNKMLFVLWGREVICGSGATCCPCGLLGPALTAGVCWWSLRIWVLHHLTEEVLQVHHEALSSHHHLLELNQNIQLLTNIWRDHLRRTAEAAGLKVMISNMNECAQNILETSSLKMHLFIK